MKGRLRVSDFHQPVEPAPLIHIPSLTQAILTHDAIFVVTTDEPIIRKYGLSNQ
jgi:hypothetical protein